MCNGLCSFSTLSLFQPHPAKSRCGGARTGCGTAPAPARGQLPGTPHSDDHNSIVSLKCRAQDSAVSPKAHHQHILILSLSGVCATAGIAMSTCKLDHPDVHFDSLQEVIHLLHNHILSADCPDSEHVPYTHQS